MYIQSPRDPDEQSPVARRRLTDSPSPSFRRSQMRRVACVQTNVSLPINMFKILSKVSTNLEKSIAGAPWR